MEILKPYVKHSSSHSAVFDGTPRTRIDIKATSGALDGEASSKGIEATAVTWQVNTTVDFVHCI